MSKLQDLLTHLTSGDEARAEGAVNALIKYGAEAIPALLDLTHASYADTRWWALRTLAQSPQMRTEWLRTAFLPVSPSERPEHRYMWVRDGRAPIGGHSPVWPLWLPSRRCYDRNRVSSFGSQTLYIAHHG